MLTYDGIFVLIDLTPNNDLLRAVAELDEWGFVNTTNMMTNVPRIFAAGDVRFTSRRRWGGCFYRTSNTRVP